MGRKRYTDEFRQWAVDLYESTPGASLKGIAADLGISRGALKEWVDKRGSGTTTAGVASAPGRAESQAAKILRLEAQKARLNAERVKLGTERDILRLPGEVFRRGDELVNRFQFVEDHKDACGVKRWCEVIEIARSSFYARPGRRPAAGGQGRRRRCPRWSNPGAAGSRPGRGPRLRVKTTIPDQPGRKYPDLTGRDFSVGEPNRRYVGDITYLPIANGTNLYLATCIDLGSRKLAGWQIADHMRIPLVEDALRAASQPLSAGAASDSCSSTPVATKFGTV